MCGFWHTQQFNFSGLPFQYYHFGTKARAQAQPSPSQARPSAQGQAWDFSSLSPLKPSPSPGLEPKPGPAHHYSQLSADKGWRPIVTFIFGQQHHEIALGYDRQNSNLKRHFYL